MFGTRGSLFPQSTQEKYKLIGDGTDVPYQAGYMESLNVQRDPTFFREKDASILLTSGTGAAGSGTFKRETDKSNTVITVPATVSTGNISWTLDHNPLTVPAGGLYQSILTPQMYRGFPKGAISAWRTNCPLEAAHVKVSACLI
jgi:hypothetical protein